MLVLENERQYIVWCTYYICNLGGIADYTPSYLFRTEFFYINLNGATELIEAVAKLSRWRHEQSEFLKHYKEMKK